MSYQLCKNDLKLLLASKTKPEAGDLHMSSSSACRQVLEWATKAQLLDAKGDLTAEGKLVATKDPYLEATVTEWLIHSNLSGNDPLWNYLVHRFLSENTSFSYKDIASLDSQIVLVSFPNAKEDIALIIENYLDPGAVSKTNFLNQKDQVFSIGKPELSNRYAVGYLLAKAWEQEFKKKSIVTVDQILDSEVKSVLGINSSQLLEQLDLLAEAEIIEQRSARPSPVGRKPSIRQSSESYYQIYRCWNDPIELLEKAYENDIATPNRPLTQSLENLLDNDDIPNFSQFLEWTVELSIFDSVHSKRVRLAS